MNRRTFLQCLRRSRLFSKEECAEVASRLPDSDQATVLACALVAQGLLTRFQARHLLSGRVKRLNLGQYRILDQLGWGGMGRVYKAVHVTMGRTVALKVVSPRLLKDAFVLALFRREVRAAAQLHHPHIATAFDANEARGVHYLAMEYVDGPSLSQLVKQEGPPPVPLACELMRQAAEALQYAHENGVVHRDIKPANLLLARLAGSEGHEGQAGGSRWPPPSAPPPVLKVVDFGLARARGPAGVAETIDAEAGDILGTLDYISPEQAEDVHYVDIRSDLYSLGCTFYYALTGQVPFPNCALAEKLARHLSGQPRPVEALRPQVPPALAAIVQKLMAKDRGQRFQTPAELLRELYPWCGSGRPYEARAAEVVLLAEVPAGGQEDGAKCPPARAAEDDLSTVGSLADSPEAASSLDAAFRKKWQHWTAIVEASGRRRGGRRWVNPVAFQGLQEELVRVCHAKACASKGEGRLFFLRLEELVKPWLTPDTLTQMDPEIHLSLLRLYQQANHDVEVALGAARTQLEDSETFSTSILDRLMKRRDRPDKATMRRLYGVEL
jgi:serine/threonine protein kinase